MFTSSYDTRTEQPSAEWEGVGVNANPTIALLSNLSARVLAARARGHAAGSRWPLVSESDQRKTMELW